MDTSWLYVDDSGVVQGPFPQKEMADWYAVGWLRKDLLVRRQSKFVFKPLFTIRPPPEFTKMQSVQPPIKKKPEKKSVHERQWYYIDAEGMSYLPWNRSR
jgi:hypothetical protein